jgi:hypothetical protein
MKLKFDNLPKAERKAILKMWDGCIDNRDKFDAQFDFHSNMAKESEHKANVYRKLIKEVMDKYEF